MSGWKTMALLCFVASAIAAVTYEVGVGIGLAFAYVPLVVAEGVFGDG